MPKFSKSCIVNIFILCSIFSHTCASSHPFLQGIHVLDPGIEEFKYFGSWNSDRWIQWVRNRYVEDVESRRFEFEDEGSETEVNQPPLYGQWVNLIIIASADEINSAFSESSNRSFTDDNRADFCWSDTAFSVYAVVRQANKESDPNKSPEIAHYNVFSCSQKKMYINAKVDENYHPILIQNLFPKKVKNPKETLRIPLVACSRVSQARGLLDEIKFQLKS